jgi:GMP synthase-like glutamine amidotransferase
MRILVLQTQDDAPPGHLGPWARARGATLDIVSATTEPQLPNPRDYDAVIALGSEASLTGTRPAWVERQVQLMKQAHAAAVPMLGICFGAQALAVALGGRVTPLPQPEIAWIEVDTDDEHAVPPGPWLSWHNDAIALPSGVREVARNRNGTQAFIHGPHTGVQFHPEASASIVTGWVRGSSGHDLDHGVAQIVLDGATGAPAQRATFAARTLFDRFAERARAWLRPGRHRDQPG